MAMKWACLARHSPCPKKIVVIDGDKAADEAAARLVFLGVQLEAAHARQTSGPELVKLVEGWASGGGLAAVLVIAFDDTWPKSQWPAFLVPSGGMPAEPPADTGQMTIQAIGQEVIRLAALGQQVRQPVHEPTPGPAPAMSVPLARPIPAEPVQVPTQHPADPQPSVQEPAPAEERISEKPPTRRQRRSRQRQSHDSAEELTAEEAEDEAHPGVG